MPLLDHFRPPLSVQRHWHAFHNSWATYLAAQLNQRLPEGYFAEANVQFGIEIDVATFSETDRWEAAGQNETWTAPAPTLTLPIALLSDVVEVLVFSEEGGPTLAGAIELVSPANKDRPAHRAAFISKCAAYLQQGVGLVVVDVVTDRWANLHVELLEQLGGAIPSPPDAGLYAAAYRPVERDGQPSLDIWHERLMLGEPLPAMPLWLPGHLCLPVELDSAYERTRREQRLTHAGT
jgi:Protein of unknown function (DUF4058)